MPNLIIGPRLLVASAQSSLPFPPVAASLGYVGSLAQWNQPVGRSVPFFDVELFAATTSNLTAAELIGGALQPVTLADDAIESADATANTATLTAHAYISGDGPVQVTNSGGAVPGGLALLTDFYLIVVDANTVKFATSRENALEGTAIDLTSTGSGTNTIVDVQGSADPANDSQRVHWHSYGLLGFAGDGVIALTSQKAYRERVQHTPRTVAYAVTATPSAACSVAIYPVKEE